MPAVRDEDDLIRIPAGFSSPQNSALSLDSVSDSRGLTSSFSVLARSLLSSKAVKQYLSYTCSLLNNQNINIVVKKYNLSKEKDAPTLPYRGRVGGLTTTHRAISTFLTVGEKSSKQQKIVNFYYVNEPKGLDFASSYPKYSIGQLFKRQLI